MKNLKEDLFNIGEKLVTCIGDVSIKMSDQAMGRCIAMFIYEPKIPIELLKESMDK